MVNGVIPDTITKGSKSDSARVIEILQNFNLNFAFHKKKIRFDTNC